MEENVEGRDPVKLIRKLSLWAVGAIIVLLAIVVAFMAYKGHRKKLDESAIVTAVTESTVVLREALGAGASDGTARVDPLLARVKAAERSPLADAAEDYVLGTREIARRRAEANRLMPQTAAARQALLAHLAAGAQRNDAWFRHAGDLKKRVESAYFEVGVQLKALDGLIDGMNESRNRLGPLMGDKLLIDTPALSAGRERIREELKRNSEELDRARQVPIG